MDFKAELKEKVKFVDEYMEKFLNHEDKYPEIIHKAMRYSVFAGGKRLRPIMVMEACRAFGGDVEKAMPFACAIEMIHTYSLIHDDLPALDNDDYRRGRLTSHKMFGENMAILAGDALLHHAFETMAEACVKMNDIKYTKAMLAIAQGAGINGMVAGQVVDVISEGKEIDKDTLDYIHKNKTAAMIIGALKAGAEIGGASDEEIKNIERVGELVGVAFQIQDDILDVTSTLEELGKPINSDEKNHKVTYATMFGVEDASKIVLDMSNEALEILHSMGDRMEFLEKLTEYLIRRKN